ncbi:MAG: TolC family protein, partial [Gemmatimonadota bacterium]
MWRAVIPAGRVVGAVVVLGLVGAPVAAQSGEATGSAGTRGGLTLEAAVSAALEANRELEDARWQLEAAQSQAREAWGSVMPSVSVSANYQRNLMRPQFFLPAIFFDSTAAPGEVIPVEGGSDNSWQAQARADQPLFNASAFLGVSAAGRFEA